MSRLCNNCGGNSTYINKKTKREYWYADKWTGKEGWVCHKCACKLKYLADPEKINKPKKDAYRANKDGYKDRANEASRKRRKDKPNERKESYQRNKERELENHKKWVENNFEQALRRNERFRQNNPDYFRNHAAKEENKIKQKERRAKHRAEKENRVPAWVDYKAIEEFYKKCPKGMQVDHIHPLMGKDSCGLHVPWNFQYLTGDENNFKGTRHDGTYDNEEWRELYKEYRRIKDMLAEESSRPKLKGRPKELRGSGASETEGG